MDGGRVVETGDHESLLAAGGLYRRLWEQQQAGISCPSGLQVL
jgi:ABC-type multidrug transport system fused ATPase/permease subunit